MTWEEKRDLEAEIVIWSMQRFRAFSPEYKRIQKVWHAAAFSGVLRGEKPHGHEAIRADWDAMVAECRRMAE